MRQDYEPDKPFGYVRMEKKSVVIHVDLRLVLLACLSIAAVAILLYFKCRQR